MLKTYRVGVIGSTGKGNYGHGLDTAFQRATNAQVVAVADDDPQGREKTGKRLGVDRLYADYRRMIEAEKLDIVSIGPRWVTLRAAMVEVAAGAGCHIYCEKPFAPDLIAADAMMAACRKAGVKIALAHQFRGMPPVQRAIRDLRAGKYGKLLRMYARPKDDHRGGGEELTVHGTHLFDMMIAFAGRPRWVSGHIAVGHRDATERDRHEGNEPVGPMAGDSIAATFGFPNGVHGFFHSTANMDRPGRLLYGLQIECEKALLHIRRLGDVYVYPASVVMPEIPDLSWQKTWIERWHFTPEHKPRDRSDWIARGNHFLVRQLIKAIEENREPISSGENALFIMEMVQGVYASHFGNGQRVPIPQTERRHPLS